MSHDTEWSTLLERVRPYHTRIAQGLSLLVLTNIFDKSIPWFIGRAVDGLKELRFDDVTRYALSVVGLALGIAVVRTLSRMRLFYVGRDIEADLRNLLLAHLQKLGPSFFQKMSTGETMSRAINDLSQVRVMFGFGMLNIVNSILAYSVALAFMLNMSVELTLWSLLPYPLLILAARWVGKAMFTRSVGSQQALGELASRVQEGLAGIRLVRAFAMEEQQRARFELSNHNALEKNMALVVLRGFMWPLLMGIGALGTLVVLWKGTGMVQAGQITVGQLVAFLTYVETLKWPTLGLGYILAVVQRGRAAYGRILDVVEMPPEVVEAPDARSPGGQGALRVENLSFEYDDKPVLDGVSFEVPAGGSLAIVGKTGSGKSTLAALLPRLLATPPGTVFVDGDDVTELKLRELRKTVAYAQQDPFLFSNTIARNVGYSLDDAYSPDAMDRIRHAASEASILTEIEELPAGFQTVVGERGVQLSGGQKQRVALARALLNEPSVLIMDDPLSAVDARTEAHILDALDRAGRDKTLVLITNRIAAASRADQILVLDEGRVVERGTPGALVNAGGPYAKLAARQALEQELQQL